MDSFLLDIIVLLILILLNGVFAMSEMAVVSSRKARLHNLADEGSLGAQAALTLHEEPSRFLSTVQVGITTIGILSGAVGESALADPIAGWIASVDMLAPYARVIGLTLTVIALTYFSVVVGELVPKRLALLAPEVVSSFISRPMIALSRLAHPLVIILSRSSEILLKMVGARSRGEPPVSDSEIKVLMEQGAEAGVFHESEQEIVSNVLRLDEQRITAIMTPRRDMAVVDLDEAEDVIRQTIIESEYARLVVCRDGLDHIVGILQTGDLLKRSLQGQTIGVAEIESVVLSPLYVPETVTTTRLMENFRHSRLQFALVVDEYGDVQGLVTLTDVLAAIVGELSVPEAMEERDMMQRGDGSWLVDGDVGIERVKYELDISVDLPGEEENSFHTLGGFIMHALGRIPAAADKINLEGIRFQLIKNKKNRVDKVLIARIDSGPAANEAS